jgi:hypothetical protein
MIRKFYRYIKRKKKILNGFYKNAKFMSAGKYVYDDSIKYITRNDYFTKQRANKMFQNNYYQVTIKFIIFLLRKTLFRNKITIPEHDLHLSVFSGTVYRPVRSINGYSDSKIFDLAHNQVLSIFSEEKDYMSVVNNYENFKEYFPMPTILRADGEQLLIMEELILFEQNYTWMKEDYLYIMTDIFERYFNYFKVCKKKGIHSFSSPEELLDIMKDSPEISFIKNKINPEIVHLQIPCLKLHGDLWTSNTLLIKANQKRICYIDWEYSNEYLFFFDIFNVMWLEVYVNNNYLYIEKYAKGDYDHSFKKMFSLFNISFKDKLRLDYFNIYFLNFYKDRVAHLEKIDKLDIINKYKRLLGKISIDLD